MKSPFIISASGILLLLPVAAQAYIGPGAGLSALGSLLALLFTIVVAALGFIWYPMYRFIKRRRGVIDEDEEEPIQQHERQQ